MIRLIACDLDGTLLNSRGELPAGTFDRIRRLKEKGVRFAAASGRQYGNLRRLFYPVRDEIAYLAENGAFVAAGQYTESFPLPRETAESVIRDILAAGMDLLICLPETCLILASGSRAYREEIIYRLRNTVTIIDDPFPFAEKCIKVSGFYPERIADLAPPLQEKWGKTLHVDIAGSSWLDFTRANKGTGLKSLSRILQIPLADTAAFGDQQNDVSMLEAVGHPYLMDTAPRELRQKGFAPCRDVSDTLDQLLSSL